MLLGSPTKSSGSASKDITSHPGRWAQGEQGGRQVAEVLSFPNDTMGLIDEIRTKIAAGQFEFSKHAVDQTIVRDIRTQEIRQAIANGQIIEDYPEDKYGPSCLILGFTKVGRPLHIQCSYPSRPLIKIITLYEPDPEIWIDFKTRRNRRANQ